MFLKLETGQWYAWEVFPSSSLHPNSAPAFLRSLARSTRVRGGFELELEFGLASGETCVETVHVHPRKKSAGYWVCRLHGEEVPEPTVVLSLLNPEWMYVHCPALRPFLATSGAHGDALQSMLTGLHR